ncbi:LysR family transcriptional regulator [Microbacteriaceae bacterium VKM Ac-2854]|nr:LysR family transcriptional regulator [Microbacteriaceae bacterium VKM Ac-2854]
MELRLLRYFLAVAETLNYARAAERLSISASPLSRSIQQLESQIGGALFLRGTRRVELTALGHALVPRAQRVIDDVSDLERDLRRRVQGHVELDVGIRSLPPELIHALLHEVILVTEPNAEVHLHPLDSFLQREQILSGKLALGLINRPSDDRRLRYLPVLHEAPGLALPDLPRFAALDVVEPGDLAGLRLLIQPGADPRERELEPIVRAVASVESVDSQILGGISAIIAEGGACCLTLANPSAPWHRYLVRDGVIVRPLRAAWERATTYLCWRADRDREDDLGPILRLAADRFSVPLSL